MVVPLNHAVIHVRMFLYYIPTTLGVPIYGNPHLGKLKHPCNDRSGQRLATKIDRSPSSLMFPSQETPHRRKSQAVATHHLAHLSR